MTTQKKIAFTLVGFSAFCVVMEVVRIHWSMTASFIFLIWNLILAWVPYMLSVAFTEYNLRKRWFEPAVVLGLWVLFLPNGPYIITDLLHLRQRVTVPMWYDVMLVSSFAWLGLLLTMLSVRNVHHKLRDHFSPVKLWIGLFILFLSSGYGIYVGRFLRWNSWDVFFRPIYLIRYSLTELIHPWHHPQPLQVTSIVCIMLSLSYMVFYFITNKSPDHEAI